jgi:hypothetical protein
MNAANAAVANVTGRKITSDLVMFVGSVFSWSAMAFVTPLAG